MANDLIIDGIRLTYGIRDTEAHIEVKMKIRKKENSAWQFSSNVIKVQGI